MVLTIDDPEVEELAGKLAERTGIPVVAVVRRALRHELDRTVAQKKSVHEAVREAQERIARLPRLDDRTPEEIIGYNELGHFD